MPLLQLSERISLLTALERQLRVAVHCAMPATSRTLYLYLNAIVLDAVYFGRPAVLVVVEAPKSACRFALRLLKDPQIIFDPNDRREERFWPALLCPRC